MFIKALNFPSERLKYQRPTRCFCLVCFTVLLGNEKERERERSLSSNQHAMQLSLSPIIWFLQLRLCFFCWCTWDCKYHISGKLLKCVLLMISLRTSMPCLLNNSILESVICIFGVSLYTFLKLLTPIMCAKLLSAFRLSIRSFKRHF